MSAPATAAECEVEVAPPTWRPANGPTNGPTTDPTTGSTAGATVEPTTEPTAAPAPHPDAGRAHAACEAARARFAELFGEPVAAVRVTLWDRPGYRGGMQGERAAIFWPASEVMAARVRDAAAAARHVESQWVEVLPHEIAHSLLAAHLRSLGREARGGYGTPLPDWFDEAIAIWAEPPGSRDVRLEQARALPQERRDLRSILAAEHPAAANAAAFAARDGTAPQADDVLWSFYPQSIAVLAFVHDAGGAEAVRELARRLMDDPADTEALAGLPGLPADFDEVVAMWAEWLAAPPN